MVWIDWRCPNGAFLPGERNCACDNCVTTEERFFMNWKKIAIIGGVVLILPNGL